MFRRFPTVLVVAFAFAALLAALPSLASASVISDCTADNSIDGNYSTAELQRALQNVPADVDQYYGCSDLIRQALLNKASDDGGGSGGGKGKKGGEALNAAATPAQRKAAERKAEQAVEDALPSAGKITAGIPAEVDRTGSKTLASSAAPGTPTAMIVTLAGLVLLFLGELAARRPRRGAKSGGSTDTSG